MSPLDVLTMKGTLPMEASTSHGITPEMYRSSVAALGLNPDLVVSVALSAQWVSITEIVTSDDGAPLVSLGQHVTRVLGGPLVTEAEVTS